ncbi:MAG: MFS transporter [Actinobacteria bacterium]|nr:MFS transporter [Actinomycetota bacterium]
MAAETLQPPAAAYRWRWQVLAVVLVAEAMDILDTTTVNVAGPSVRRSLGGGIGLVQWLSAAYTLAFAVLLITGSRLGDRYGPRRMFLTGAAGFTLASLACGLAVSPGLLIGARVVQGSFAAILLPQGIGLLTRTFSENERARAFSAYAPVLSLAAVGGPLVAGALIRWDLWGSGWRLIFLINLVLGAAAVAAGLRYLPADGPATVRRLDGRGVLIIGGATFAVIYPLIQGPALGWPGWTFALLAAGLAGFGWFAHHERRSSAPLIEPTLLRRRGYLAGAAVALAFFATTAGLLLTLSFYAQYGLGYTALGTGLLLTPMAAGNVAGALLAMRLVPRWGGRATIQACLAVALAGLIALAGLAGLTGLAGPVLLAYNSTPASHTGPSGLVLAAPILALGVGLGGAIAPLFATILTGVTPAQTGSASGSLSAVQQLAGSAGVATLATLYAATAHPAAHGLAVATLATAAVLGAGLALTFLLPGRLPDANHHDA